VVQHHHLCNGDGMTLITFEDGKAVFRDGKVGTEQACCCDQECPCLEPCGGWPDVNPFPADPTPEVFLQGRNVCVPEGTDGIDGGLGGTSESWGKNRGGTPVLGPPESDYGWGKSEDFGNANAWRIWLDISCSDGKYVVSVFSVAADIDFNYAENRYTGEVVFDENCCPSSVTLTLVEQIVSEFNFREVTPIEPVITFQCNPLP